jgi:methylthioribose-1-phosphate isomerase
MTEPIIWKKNQKGEFLIYLLDQRYLPGRKIYRLCRNYLQVADCIKKMVVRGAPALGVTTAFAIAQAVNRLPFTVYRSPSKEDFFEYLNKVGKTLVSTRPTAVNISWAVNKINKVVQEFKSFRHGGSASGMTSVQELKEIVKEEAEKIYEENKKMDRKIALNGAKLFSKNTNVLTHCNTGPLATAGYGTALGVIFAAYRQGKIKKVYVDETRPYLQGARLTVWELVQARVPCVLICDNMAGYLMQEGEINAVIVGADRIAANGDSANKIGTYSVAVLAKEHRIPFYIAAPGSSIDLSLSSGEKIKIEERNPDEVRYVQGKLVSLKNVAVCNPAFDVTPAKYITAIITEKGVICPPYFKNLKIKTQKSKLHLKI